MESDSDRSWLLARTAYFIGEYFVQKFSGYWFVNATYGSRYFARYVVGGFSVATGEVIDPFEMATVYVDTPATRDLNALIIDVERSWGSV
ncbi:Uncharacterised protein [Bordetella ansorpii]|uniref:Uncharacterized protein n=1 Tax=Bordetella ansorpii TaxID=288768 RepID=A0A157SFT0_9BORD|nr:Uncharacterised protein [Bordetella ansorpii]